MAECDPSWCGLVWEGAMRAAGLVFIAMVAAGCTHASDSNAFRAEEIRAAERAVIAALESTDRTAV